jgi:hypothetical protein
VFTGQSTSSTTWNASGTGVLAFFLKGNPSPRRKSGRKRRFFSFFR